MADELSLLETLQGTLSLVFVIITVIVGIIIISKYFKYKNITFLLVGIAWTGMCFGWLGDVINLFMHLTGNPYISDELYLILVNAFLPLFVVLWLIALSDLLHFEKKKLLVLTVLVLGVVFEIIFFVLLFTDTEYIGIRRGPFHYEFSLFTDIFMLSLIVFILWTGIKFALESMKSENPEIRLKGKFLIAAFITFTCGALFDSQAALTEATVVIVRIVLISGSLLFYSGFILPDWMKKLFLKSEKVSK